MNKQLPDNWIETFFKVTFFSFLLYLPVFLVRFAFHNDGAYISCKGNNIITSYNEGAWVFAMDRPVLAAYCGLQSWMIHNFSDLALCRFLSFLLVTVFNFVFYRFLIKNCRLSSFWAAAITAIFFFIPPTLLSVIWCNHQACLFSLLLSTLSYFIFNNSFPRIFSKRPYLKRGEAVAGVLIAAGLFLTALFCYPPNVLVILVFPFARVLFHGPEDRQKIRGLVFSDIFFVICLMGIFRLLSVKFVIPWALAHYQTPQTQGLYSLDLTNDLSSKVALLFSILGYALRGIWDFSGQWTGSVIALAFITASCGVYGFNRIKASLFSSYFIERLCLGLALFILANSPALLAKGCTDINDYGYRILVASMMMGSLLIFKIFILAAKQSSLTIKKLAIVFVVSSMLLAFWLETQAVSNSHMEYTLAMRQLKQTDLSKIHRLLFIVNNRGETLIGQKLPLEFSLLSVLTEHVNAYTIEYTHNRNYNMELPQIINRGLRIFVAPGIKVIDLSSDALDKKKDPRAEDVMVRPQSLSADNVLLKILESTDSTDVVMGFSTIFSPNAYLPLWFIDKDEKKVSLEIISRKPLPIVGYNCFVSTENPNTQAMVKWILQGSDDGLIWTNLDIQANILPLEKAMLFAYPVNAPKFYNNYRIVFNKEEYAQRIGIELIKLKLQN